MKTKDMMYISLFTAVVAALGLLPPIYLPFAPLVPITAQTLGVMLAGGILGAKRGSISLLIFVIIVAIGAPVLPGARGGLSVLVGPTGGYILSWPIAAFVIGFLVERFWNHLNLWKVVCINIFGGIMIIYAMGIPYLSLMTDIPLNTAAISSLVYIPGDLIKVILAGVIVLSIRRAKPLIQQ